MKRFALILLLACVAMVACQPSHTMRVMTYNAHNCIGMDGALSCERIAQVIINENVEAVALQELDSMTMRLPNQDILKNIADLTGMHPTFGASIDFRGGKYGIGVLTREKPISWKRIPLPCRSEPRSLLIVELEDYYFCSTHLSLHAEDRTTSAAIIAEELGKLNKPVIIGGDFNAEPDEEAIQNLIPAIEFMRGAPEKLTYPADTPRIEIDYIGILKAQTKSVSERQSYVVNAPVESDHRPLVSEFEYKKR